MSMSWSPTSGALLRKSYCRPSDPLPSKAIAPVSMNLLGSQKYVFPVNKFTLNKDSLLIGFLEISPCVPDLFRFFMTTLYLSLEMAIFKYPYKKTGGFCSATRLSWTKISLVLRIDDWHVIQKTFKCKYLSGLKITLPFNIVYWIPLIICPWRKYLMLDEDGYIKWRVKRWTKNSPFC